MRTDMLLSCLSSSDINLILIMPELSDTVSEHATDCHKNHALFID
jgi:hypothetical protein